MLLPGLCSGQDSTITVSGHVFDSSRPATRLEDLMIINLRTAQGFFGKADGTFSVMIRHTDTIMIASSGYEFKKICFVDSVARSTYQFEVPLIKLNIKPKRFLNNKNK